MSMETGFAIYATFGIALGLFGLWLAGKKGKH